MTCEPENTSLFQNYIKNCKDHTKTPKVFQKSADIENIDSCYGYYGEMSWDIIITLIH